MRMWGVDPALLCGPHLSGEHKELHMMRGSLRLGHSMQGYFDKQQIDVSLINSRHDAIVREFKRRGWNHQSPLPTLKVTGGSIDAAANLKELYKRCPDCRARIERHKYKGGNIMAKKQAASKKKKQAGSKKVAKKKVAKKKAAKKKAAKKPAAKTQPTRNSRADRVDAKIKTALKKAGATPELKMGGLYGELPNGVKLWVGQPPLLKNHKLHSSKAITCEAGRVGKTKTTATFWKTLPHTAIGTVAEIVQHINALAAGKKPAKRRAAKK